MQTKLVYQLCLYLLEKLLKPNRVHYLILNLIFKTYQNKLRSNTICVWEGVQTLSDNKTCSQTAKFSNKFILKFITKAKVKVKEMMYSCTF